MTSTRCCAFLVVVLALGGCKKKDDGGVAATGSGSATGSATGSSGSAMTGSSAGSDDPSKPHHAGNCPSTVVHSTTTAELKDKDVLVTITSTDKDAVSAVQTRADELLAGRVEHRANGGGTSHKQNGEHGGGMGMCPVYLPEGATAVATRQLDGVVVKITAVDPAALKTEVDARIKKVNDWVAANIAPGDKGTGGGVGGGRNNEGMNHSGKGDGKGLERKHDGSGGGGGNGTGGGGGAGTGGGSGGGSGSAAKP